MQAEYALGYRVDKELDHGLPAYHSPQAGEQLQGGEM
jgi:hypothetical protein